MTRTRFPRRVYGEGSEPDPRFSLANERTFLAWLRTALALFAAAVALEAFDLPASPTLRLASAAILVVVGVVSIAGAWFGWMATERSLRSGTSLPGMTIGAVVTAGILVAVVLVTMGTLL